MRTTTAKHRKLKSQTLPTDFTLARSLSKIERLLFRAMQPDVSPDLHKRASFALTHFERIKLALRTEL